LHGQREAQQRACEAWIESNVTLQRRLTVRGPERNFFAPLNATDGSGAAVEPGIDFGPFGDSMTQRNKSLLEAFKASQASGGTPAPVQAQNPTPAAPQKAGHVPTPGSTATSPASSAPPVVSEPRVSLMDSRSIHDVVLQRSQIKLLALVVALALVCAFLIGRASVRGVAAADGDSSSGANDATLLQQQQQPEAPAASSTPAGAPTAQPANVDRSPRALAEAALLDPKNVYTIKLIDYINTEGNKRLANSTCNYVNEQGVLACVVNDTGHISILVGAAATKSELDALMLRCRTMNGPPPASKAAEFSSAYLERIEHVFPRNK
jgi:hypothetical protein